MNKIIAYIVVLLVLIGGFYALNNYIYEKKQAVAAPYPRDAEYVIDGKRVKLSDGTFEEEGVVTTYFGNELAEDLNGDGAIDTALLLTQTKEGSPEILFYAVAAIYTERGYVGSDGFLLGDRIAPQTIVVSQNPRHKNVIAVNYAERKPGESFDVRASMGKSAYLKLDPDSMRWAIVEPDFEGEADPSRMTLGMKDWVWMKALYNDGREIAPKVPGKFGISFAKDGRYSLATDCNSMGGSYVAEGRKIAFSQGMSTLMYCEGSQESEFSALIRDVEGYSFTSKGELVLDLKFDSGSVIFR
ncbi:MAG: META domain-containing protein [Candidatus Taylorbacteria bacterium]|nr:META domain-containing protein [Candidatus Taylorbacteria bacterium]